MIIDIDTIKDKYRNYTNIFEKVKVEEKNMRLFKIKRSLYSDSITEHPFLIANVLYSPSYISFETALSFYNMIPERVDLIKSATFQKNKSKLYENIYGKFYFQDVNKNAYPFGIDTINIDGIDIFIASREKALLDTISIKPPVKNLYEIKSLLFDDMRLNNYIFDELDKNVLINLSKLYSSQNCKIFEKLLERIKHD